MRGAVRDFDEYILELQPELTVGLDVVAHVIVLEYYVDVGRYVECDWHRCINLILTKVVTVK